MKFLFLTIMVAVVVSAQQCGQQNAVQQLIFGGTAVNAGDYPWVVPLFRKFDDKFFCGANLISHQHVLTAAHCIFEKGAVKGLSADSIYAYIGRFDLTNTAYEEKSQKADIKKIVLHPKWSPSDVRFDADIAILILKNRVEFSETVQPICLPTSGQDVFKLRGSVVGYGKSESVGLHENIPRKVEISSYTNEDCFFTDYQFARFASQRTFCAGERGKTPCQGDSGSGFFIDVRSTFTIMGLVSASTIQECGQNDFVLFTSVPMYSDWINQEMGTTFENEALDAAFNEFDDQQQNLKMNLVDTACTVYRDSGSSYACYINGLNAPENDFQLRVRSGQHNPKRTDRDVSVIQLIGGNVPRFPDLTDVVNSYPQFNGFGIAFANMKHIDRSKFKVLSRLKYFFISDNQLESIPPDTFLDLKDLELIDICRNNIKNLDPTWISKMPKLRVFKARSNKFQYVPANMFKNNPQLEEILFDFNELKRIDTNFNDLKQLKTLKILSNPCIDKAYCIDQNDKNCVRNLQQFSLLVRGLCGKF